MSNVVPMRPQRYAPLHPSRFKSLGPRRRYGPADVLMLFQSLRENAHVWPEDVRDMVCNIIEGFLGGRVSAQDGRRRAAVSNSRKRSEEIAEKIVAVAGALQDAGMIRQRIARRGAQACELERVPSLKTIRAAMKKKGRFGSGSGEDAA